MNPQTPTNKTRLRTIRKFLRSGPATQTQVGELLKIDQQSASLLMRHLVKVKTVKESPHKEKATNGRRSVIVYELTDSYLATLKTDEPCEQDHFDREIASVPQQPSLLQRLKAWLFGGAKSEELK